MGSYRAAIVGLGQVGMLFDEDASRDGVWTHFTAYERLQKRGVTLVAVCEPDPEKQAKARERCGDLKVYAALEDMLAQETLDLVSLCTPPAYHSAQIQACAGKVKAILCEKPLAEEGGDAEAAVHSCRESDTLLAVNYYKRFDGSVPAVKQLLESGAIGELVQANGWYSGPFGAVGSHMVDLLRFFCGKLELHTVTGTSEDAFQAHLESNGGARVNLAVTGQREDLIFECDLVGTEGRLRLLENCASYEWYRFEASPRYGGYRELVKQSVDEIDAPERFLPLFEEVLDMLDGTRDDLSSGGENALETQRLMREVSLSW